MANSYKQTMNLPRTDFATPVQICLKPNPKRLQHWNDIDIYAKALEKNKDNAPFILHDGFLRTLTAPSTSAMPSTRSSKTSS